MTDENITIGELGAYTNNSMNREGLKKLVDKVNSGGSGGVEYTAGENIQISAENVISATDTKYTAGTNVSISDQNVISATDTKYTAGTNVSISDQNVISATDTTYTAGTGINISAENVISASGGGGGDWVVNTDNNWSNIFERDGTNYNTKVKKDVYIYWKNGYINFGFLPKGLISRTSCFYLTSPNYNSSGTSSFTIYSLMIEYSSVSLQSTTLDVVNQTITNSSNSVNKSDFTVLVKD